MAFSGYLLKSGSDLFPHKYIDYSSWQTTPNQREEIKAYRDENTRHLVRITAGNIGSQSGKAKNCKTAISFSTQSDITLAQKQEIQAWFESHYAGEAGDSATQVKLQRKLPITYWNDEDNAYNTGYFYLADIRYTIKSISSNSITYDAIEIELVEY